MIHVQIQDLKETWPTVRPGLETIVKKIKADWIPEDVYSSLMSNTSQLYLAYDREEYDGFVVLQQLSDYCGPILFIWCAYGNAKNHFAEIRDIAKSVGAKRIRFMSPRKGFARNFKAITTIYEEEV